MDARAGWMLAIDLGTGGPKVGAVGLDGRLLAAARRSVRTCYTADGGATQDPDEWWGAIVDATREVVSRGPAPPAAVAGVGITGQWGSTVPVGEDGRAVGSCLLWADTRAGPLSARRLGGRLAVAGYSPGNLVAWMRLSGGAPSPAGADPTGHELLLRERHPEVYARTAKLLEPLDYLALRLTGRAAATPASMILSWLTDNRPGAPVGYVSSLVRRAGRDPARLPELVATGSPIGELRSEVAQELGVRPGVPVVGGVPDLHTAWLGSGAVAPFAAHVTISTTSWISCEVPFKKTDVAHQMASVPGLRAGGYLVANNHETAGLALEWLRGAVAPGVDFSDLTAAAALAAPGSGDVVFMPWLNGERSPVEDRALRAGFLNLSMATGRAELIRAVLEGVAYNARWLLDAVDGFAGRRLDPLRIMGGGAQSDLWCQVHADVLDRRVERVREPLNANLRGAGLFAAVSLRHLTLEEAAASIEVDAVFEPSPAARRVHERVYREYRGLYRALRGTYGRLNRR